MMHISGMIWDVVLHHWLKMSLLFNIFTFTLGQKFQNSLLMENGTIWSRCSHCHSFKQDILAVPISQYLDKDELVWCPSPKRVFSHNLAYRALSNQGIIYRWFNVVWGRSVQPIRNFLAWQICFDVLQTQDRLLQKGILSHSNCCFYHRSPENSRNLSFNWAFKRKYGLT